MTESTDDTKQFTVTLTTPSENTPSKSNNTMTYIILAIAAALLAFLFGG